MDSHHGRLRSSPIACARTQNCCYIEGNAYFASSVSSCYLWCL